MKTREELQALRERAKAALAVRDSEGSARVVVVSVSQTGCKGLCDKEPIVEVHPPKGPGATYGRVTPEVMRRIVAEHIVEGQVIADHVIATGTEAG